MSLVDVAGIHWLQPFVTTMVQIRLTPETKMMNPLICTTRDGVRNVFRDVQVVRYGVVYSKDSLINIYIHIPTIYI